jgi:hypothetical protein
MVVLHDFLFGRGDEVRGLLAFLVLAGVEAGSLKGCGGGGALKGRNCAIILSSGMSFGTPSRCLMSPLEDESCKTCQ